MIKISLDNLEDQKSILVSYFNENGCEPNEISREHSWKLCYDAFGRFINKEEPLEDDIDYLALQLGFYLASWGMYRGSCFIHNYSYKIHAGAIDIIKKYGALYDLKLCNINESIIEEIINLKDELKEHYCQYKYSSINDSDFDNNDVERVISETLLSKILLGTLACAPAYDEYFVKGLRKANISPRSFTDKSLKSLVEENLISISELKESLKRRDYGDYPDMKILDMFYWELGHRKWKVV